MKNRQKGCKMDQDLNDVSLVDAAPEQTAEKLLPQTHVKKIAARENEQGYARGRREAEEEYNRKLAEMQQAGQQQQQRNAGGTRDMDADAMYQQVQERFNTEMQERQLKQEMENIANNYVSKMQQGKAAYDDFDAVTGDFDPAAFPQLVYLVAGIDNAADVIYDLSKNPSKLVTLDALAQKSPKQATAELLKLSRSIAENQHAKNEANNQTTAAPLDHLQPSRISGSNGKQSIRDLRDQPWLRG